MSLMIFGSMSIFQHYKLPSELDTKGVDFYRDLEGKVTKSLYSHVELVDPYV